MQEEEGALLRISRAVQEQLQHAVLARGPPRARADALGQHLDTAHGGVFEGESESWLGWARRRLSSSFSSSTPYSSSPASGGVSFGDMEGRGEVRVYRGGTRRLMLQVWS